MSRSRTRGGVLLFKGHDDHSGRRVAVKVFGQAGLAAIEEAGLATASRSGARIARALLCEARQGVLVTEWIEGAPLRRALAQRRGPSALVEAGSWLRGFHRQARHLVPYQPLSALVPVTEVAIASRVDMRLADRVSFRAQVAALMRTASRRCPGLGWQVRLHGDFHPGNLILGPAGPVGIDFGDTRTGSPLEDLARMTVQLDLLAEMNPAALAGHPEAARDQFLRGYGLGRVGRSRLALAEWGELLRRWQIACRANAPRPDRGDAVRRVLARRGWLVAVLALLVEPAPQGWWDLKGKSEAHASPV